ncbi:MAG: hypothetical protein M1339_07670 [Bacteroidetes bacterium]|nr:hypothetical protein [Bacteroidota bacterium]
MMKKYLLPLFVILAVSNTSAHTLPPAHHAPNREFHMSNVVIRLHFNMTTKTVFGEVSETITPFRTSLDSIHLNAVDMKIKSVTMRGVSLDYRYDGKILTIFLRRENIDDILPETIRIK